MRYKKKVEATDTGMVFAEVYRMSDDGQKMEGRVGLKFYYTPWHSQEARFTKAHAWADERIKLLEKHNEGLML